MNISLSLQPRNVLPLNKANPAPVRTLQLFFQAITYLQKLALNEIQRHEYILPRERYRMKEREREREIERERCLLCTVLVSVMQVEERYSF